MIPVIRKITTIEEMEATIKAAENDKDNMRFPSHMITKDDKIVGGWCMGAIPLVLVWHDTKSISPRDSLTQMQTIDAIMHDRGNKSYFMACNSHSPYYSKMEKLGYNKGWATNLFYKNIGRVSNADI
jgi:hypothetical protein